MRQTLNYSLLLLLHKVWPKTPPTERDLEGVYVFERRTTVMYVTGIANPLMRSRLPAPKRSNIGGGKEGK